LIQQVLYGVTRSRDRTRLNNFGQNLGQRAGLRGTLDPNCPQIWFDRDDNFEMCAQFPSNYRANTVSTLNYSLIWIKGTHSIKTGSQVIRFNENIGQLGGNFLTSAAGSFLFGKHGGGLVHSTADTNATGGETFADFFLGWPSQSRVGYPQIVGNREAYIGSYIQDDWKVTRRLTLNLGLRWDINVPYGEVNGQIAGFDPDLPNPGASGRLGTLVFYGHGPGRLGIERPGFIFWNKVAPRIGLAYQINNKTVFRGFAGLIYQGSQNGNGEFADRTGFFTEVTPAPPVDPFGLIYSWDAPFPIELAGKVPNTDPAQKNGQNLAYQRRDGIGRPPELYMASAGFQRELRGNVLAEATWLFNGMKHAHDHNQINGLAPVYWSLGPTLNLPLNSPQVRALGFGKPYPEFDDNLPLHRALRPYPQYPSISEDAATHTSSTYHAAIFKAQKRFSAGLTFLASYTISKYVTDTDWSPGAFGAGFRDPFNRRLDKSIARYDIPQRLVLAYSYELPFGKGKKFLNSAHPVTQAVAGGWQLSAIHRYQSGTPALVTGRINVPIPGVNSVADRVAGVPVRSSVACGDMVFGDPSRNYIYNAGNAAQASRTGRPLAYQPPGDFQVGNMPLKDSSARQCGLLNEDITFTKRFTLLGDRLHARVGAEMFNIFNRHAWYPGDGNQNITAANFGEIRPLQFYGPRQIQMYLRVEW
jgi:hypothetical protein